MRAFTICALCFGDYPKLALRCLESIRERAPQGSDIRIGLNAVGDATAQLVDELTRATADRFRWSVLQSTENQLKYPKMRQMLRVRAIDTPYVTWFDDDSCIRPDAPGDWFARCAAAMADADAMGQRWFMNLAGRQAEWVRSRSWYGGKPVAPHHRVAFPAGGWWCARTAILARFDWPDSQIAHRGGDVMLGELCRQQGLRLKWWHEHVAINADADLRGSKSKRRGEDSDPVGYHGAWT